MMTCTDLTSGSRLGNSILSILINVHLVTGIIPQQLVSVLPTDSVS